MALRYEVLAEEQVARVFGEGTADFDSFIGVMNSLAADPAFPQSFDVLADFSRVDYTPSFREIKRFASEFKTVRAALPPRVGIVVRDKVQLKLGRFASMVAGLLKFDLSVFEDPAAADRWLGRRRAKRKSDVEARIRDLWAQPQLAALATITEDGRPWSRYVLTTADHDLTIRFATYLDSRKTRQIEANPEVHLVAGAANLATADRWVQVEGRASVLESADECRLAWHDGLEPFFEGPEDPKCVAVVVRPYRIEYVEMGASAPELWRD